MSQAPVDNSVDSGRCSPLPPPLQRQQAQQQPGLAKVQQPGQQQQQQPSAAATATVPSTSTQAQGGAPQQGQQPPQRQQHLRQSTSLALRLRPAWLPPHQIHHQQHHQHPRSHPHMDRSRSVPELGTAPGGGRIVLGVCAMSRKARSQPMEQVLSRIMAGGEFELRVFEEEVLLHAPVSEWPVVDCLLSWHSEGFPLDKAQAYVARVRPFCINDVGKQELLLDRRRVYRVLQDSGVPIPRHIVVDRDRLAAGQDPEGFEEGDDYVQLCGVRISKPFVEKPADGEDHNIFIYYPHAMGGGVKRLYRKVQDRSADYDPLHSGRVRRGGSFIYEEFLATGGTDVKVYTVGPRYAHAEARKSPVVDGRVLRTPDGKEMRFPVVLSPQEKEIARMVCLAFGQKVCGFDLLRSEERGGSYVCDVNGWSFVKNSSKYYDDAADILRSIILQALAPQRLQRLHHLPALPPTPSFARLAEALGVADPAAAGHSQAAVAAGHSEAAAAELMADRLRQASSFEDLQGLQFAMAAAVADASGGSPLGAMAADGGSGASRVSAGVASALPGGAGCGLPGEELRCVLAVVRHGDRTPKQKLKVAVDQPELLALFARCCDAKGKQAKLKSPAQLQELLDITRVLLQRDEQALQQQQGAATAHATAHATADATADNAPPRALGAQPTLDAESARAALQDGATAAAPAAAGTGGAAAGPPLQPLQPLDDEVRCALQVVRSVLGAGGSFSGVNRKAQLKPRTWSNAAVAAGQTPPDAQAAAAAPNAAAVAAAGTSGELEQLQGQGHLGGGGSSSGGGGSSAVSSLLLIVKWGGVLTHAGRRQAEALGEAYRLHMYPRAGPAGGGLLRLHSTYRHDFKIYSSDEGRVQTSAAAFTQGLLSLEGGSLTPILVSLVNKDAAMLEAFGNEASADMRQAKEELCRRLNDDGGKEEAAATAAVAATVVGAQPQAAAEGAAAAAATVSCAVGDEAALEPLQLLHLLRDQLQGFVALLEATLEAGQSQQQQKQQHAHMAGAAGAPAATAAAAADPSAGYSYSTIAVPPQEWRAVPGVPCSGERWLLLHDRWAKLLGSFFSFKKGTYDISKVPDIYDAAKHDLIHNARLELTPPAHGPAAAPSQQQLQLQQQEVPQQPLLLGPAVAPLYATAQRLADLVVPYEYGLDPQAQLHIGSAVCRELLGKLLADMGSMREESWATQGGASDSGTSTPLSALSTCSSSHSTELPSLDAPAAPGGSSAGPGSTAGALAAATPAAAAAAAAAAIATASGGSGSGLNGRPRSVFADAAAAVATAGTAGSGAQPAAALVTAADGATGSSSADHTTDGSGSHGTAHLQRSLRVAGQAATATMDSLATEFGSASLDDDLLLQGGSAVKGAKRRQARASPWRAPAAAGATHTGGLQQQQQQQLAPGTVGADAAAGQPSSSGWPAGRRAGGTEAQQQHRLSRTGSCNGSDLQVWLPGGMSPTSPPHLLPPGAADVVSAQAGPTSITHAAAAATAMPSPSPPQGLQQQPAAAAAADPTLQPPHPDATAFAAAAGAAGVACMEGEAGLDPMIMGSVGDVGGEEVEAEQMLHRLCPQYASDINSPLRHVRTRVYFTSESHIHALVNVLRYCHLAPTAAAPAAVALPAAMPAAVAQAATAAAAAGNSGGGSSCSSTLPLRSSPPVQHDSSTSGGCSARLPSWQRSLSGAQIWISDATAITAGSSGVGAVATACPQSANVSSAAADSSCGGGLLCAAGQALLGSTPEFDYLTQVVFRMFENKEAPVRSPERFRVEVCFSPGASRAALQARAHALGAQHHHHRHRHGGHHQAPPATATAAGQPEAAAAAATAGAVAVPGGTKRQQQQAQAGVGSSGSCAGEEAPAGPMGEAGWDHCLPVAPLACLNCGDGAVATLSGVEALLLPFAAPHTANYNTYALEVALRAPGQRSALQAAPPHAGDASSAGASTGLGAKAAAHTAVLAANAPAPTNTLPSSDCSGTVAAAAASLAPALLPPGVLAAARAAADAALAATSASPAGRELAYALELGNAGSLPLLQGTTLQGRESLLEALQGADELGEALRRQGL